MTPVPVPDGSALSLVEEVKVAAASRAVELESYRRLGRAAREEAGALGPFLAGASRAHAWRAREWEGLLPVSAPLWRDVEEAAARGRALAAELLETALAAGSPAGRVAALVRGVYERLLEDYRALVDASSRARGPHPSAGPLLRAARRVADDLAASRREGEEVVLALVADGERSEGDESARRCAARWEDVGGLLGAAGVRSRLLCATGPELLHDRPGQEA
jgi:hypothetical protein